MSTQSHTLAGVDLAWIGENNPSAICLGELQGNTLTINDCLPAVYGIDRVLDTLVQAEVHGLAIDAPLIIPNLTGSRDCEKAITKAYGGRHAGCHPSNQARYPNADSVRLGQALHAQGFEHLGKPEKRWQIECYPHPSLIECFGLPQRLRYKKGRVGDKRTGQINLARLITGLSNASALRLRIPDSLSHHLDVEVIEQLTGQALKSNEDALDAMVCLYIAALYQANLEGQTFGNETKGYVWIPTPSEPCMPWQSVLGAETLEPNTAVRVPHSKPTTQQPSARPPQQTRKTITERPNHYGAEVGFQSGDGITTQVGHLNKNRQRVHGHRGRPGTDLYARSYKMECTRPGCGHTYGVNGSNIHVAKCPVCQDGQLDLRY